MGLDCSKIDEWTYDPIQESPAAYVADMRKRMEMHAVIKIEEHKANTEEMTVEEMRAYYDRIGQDEIEGMDAVGQQNIFDRFLKEQNEKREKQARANRMHLARANMKQLPGLRNRSIKPRAFNRGSMNTSTLMDRTSIMSVRRESQGTNLDNSIVINRVSNNDGDDSLNDVSMADVSMMSLNDTSQMMAVHHQNTSMAGMSDSSAGRVQKISSGVSDGGSMYSGTGDDVQVKRAGNDVTQDMGNTSMAGLSDMSMGDIQRVTNDSMADYSMASLGDDQMASVDQSANRQVRKESMPGESSETNILDGLKKELGMVEVSNPQNDNSFIKQQKQLDEDYRATVVYDENEEDYDSEAEEGEDEDARQKRRSFKKTRSSVTKEQALGMPPTPKTHARLQDLVNSGARKSVAARYVQNNAIEEILSSQESPESPDSTVKPQAPVNGFKLKLGQTQTTNEGSEDSETSSDEEEKQKAKEHFSPSNQGKQQEKDEDEDSADGDVIDASDLVNSDSNEEDEEADAQSKTAELVEVAVQEEDL